MRIGGLKQRIGGNSKVGCVLDIDFKKIGQGHGQSFMDRSVYGHLCTNYGAVWNLDGRYFDGSDDYLDLGDKELFRPDAKSMTFDVLFKTEKTVADQGLFTKGDVYFDGRGAYFLQITASSNTLWRATYQSDFFTAQSSEVIGKLTEAVMLADHERDKISLAKNGNLFAPDASNITETANTQNDALLLGCYFYDNARQVYFKGCFQRVRFYNFADYTARILARSIDSRRN